MGAYHFNWFLAWQAFPRFYWGLALGLELAALSLLIGSVVGMAGAFGRSFGPAWLRLIVVCYVEFIRNIPLLLLVYFAFYGLPKLGIYVFDNLWSFIVALSVYSGAYLTEVFRAGVNSVPVGYTEAAKAVGLNYFSIPFNAAAPDPDLVPTFLAAVTAPANQPAFIHCAGGGRAASMWLVKRMQVDGWDQQRAVEEATALGLTNERLKQFALDWVQTHKKP